MNESLGFAEVDDLSFAAQRNRLPELKEAMFAARDLGPFMESALLAASNILPKLDRANWLCLGTFERLYLALRSTQRDWICPTSRQLGFFKLSGDEIADDARNLSFCLSAQRAAVSAGFPKETASQFAASIGELVSNVYEHSGAAHSGVAAFNATDGAFEFTVADWGMGILASLKSNERFAEIEDHGAALRQALQDGVSRHNEKGRGNGFRPIFIGLANLNGLLRFRSGDYALTMEGDRVGSIPWKTAEKIFMRGFFVAVACRLRARVSAAEH